MKIYFMGICGTAMGQAALLMRDLGHEVCGADTGIYPPMSTVLASSGITLYDGYDPVRLLGLKPDLVVVGNAQSRGHPEVEWLLETRALPIISLPALLNESVLRHRHNIVVAGTHGKTTTTTLTAFLLKTQNALPGWLIGGVPRDLPSGSAQGKLNGAFVIEGDEYDSAFFDKRSKFIHYAPNILICNNLEFDHADIFRDLADIQRTFSHVMRIVPRNGFILANGDDANLAPLIDGVKWTTVLRVGEAESNHLRISGFHEDSNGVRFKLVWTPPNGGPTVEKEVAWQLPGKFNARNAAMAALAAGLALNRESTNLLENPLNYDLGILKEFLGVRRRQEVRASKGKITILEDFGHHPTAIRETLVSLRARYPMSKIVAAFEPRSNTACKKVFEHDFTDALSQADHVLLGPVHRSEKLPTADRLDTSAMAARLIAQGKQALAANSAEEVFLSLKETCQKCTEATLIVFFSNGSFDGIIDKTTNLVSS